MESKEEILSKYFMVLSRYSDQKEMILDAMEEYAQQFQPPSSTSVQVEELAKRYADQKQIDRWVYTMEQRHKFCIEDFKAGFLAASPKGNDEDAVDLPNDIENFLYWAEKEGWVFIEVIWIKDGWQSRKTNELYSLFKQSKDQT